MTPELWLNVLTFVTGANLVLTLGVTAAAGYAGWRYVYVPWNVMREDIKRLAEQLGTVKEEIGLRRAMSLSDEEQAMIERRARARQLWSSPTAPTAPIVQRG